MESIQTIEPNELPNWETSCKQCKKSKVILLRNHMAEASHKARVFAGYKMKFLRDPKVLQQHVYNQENTRDLLMEIEHWLNDAGTRHYALRTIINAYALPLPEALSKECNCASNATIPTVLRCDHRPLLMRPLGADRFKFGGIY